MVPLQFHHRSSTGGLDWPRHGAITELALATPLTYHSLCALRGDAGLHPSGGGSPWRCGIPGATAGALLAARAREPCPGHRGAPQLALEDHRSGEEGRAPRDLLLGREALRDLHALGLSE